MELVVYCTVVDKVEADTVAHALLEEKACACVNVIEGVKSLFFWEGKVQSEQELLLIIKTSSDVYEKLEEIIKKNHSYDVPEIIALPIIKGSKDYLEWIREITKEKLCNL